MDKAGKSILWFLGACLIFSQGLITIVAKAFTSVEGIWILLFGFLCLITVLGALIIMFIRDPTFITAERGDLGLLALIITLIKKTDVKSLRNMRVIWG